MPEHDERNELAPRDIVARAIDFEMKKHGLDYVYLDTTHLGEACIKEHFPMIYARFLSLGLDILKSRYLSFQQRITPVAMSSLT